MVEVRQIHRVLVHREYCPMGFKALLTEFSDKLEKKHYKKVTGDNFKVCLCLKQSNKKKYMNTIMILH